MLDFMHKDSLIGDALLYTKAAMEMLVLHEQMLYYLAMHTPRRMGRMSTLLKVGPSKRCKQLLCSAWRCSSRLDSTQKWSFE